MKTCPYCGEEIKDAAKKCRYCGEFLQEKENTKEEKKEVKQYGFRGRFFRKDLELNMKWGHRFLKVVFFLVILGCPIRQTFKNASDSSYYWMEVIDKVEDRLGEDVTKLSSLLKVGEYINDFTYDVGKFGEVITRCKDIDGYYDRCDKRLQNTYCSKSWDTQKIDKVSKETGLGYLSRADGRINRSSNNQVLGEINNYKCVTPDGLNGIKFLNHENIRLDDLYFMEHTFKSSLYGLWYWFSNRYIAYQIMYLIPGIIIIILYYKLILYIIYGGFKLK